LFAAIKTIFILTAAGMYYKFLRPQMIGELDGSSRRSRSDYAIGITVLAVETCILPFLIAFFWQDRIKPSTLDQVLTTTSYGPILGSDVLIAIILALTTIWFLIHYFGLTVQRCRDFGSPGWSAGLVLVPILGWFFAAAIFFIPGDVDANQFGPNPRNSKPQKELQ
jgi:uncharacterized membrane protein YhaH (DUF805 family)